MAVQNPSTPQDDIILYRNDEGWSEITLRATADGRYDLFDERYRTAEAITAETEDIEELEKLEKRLGNGTGRSKPEKKA